LTQYSIRHENAFASFSESIDRGDLQCAQLICSFTSSPSQLFFVSAPLPTSTADTFRPVVRGKRGVVAGGSPLSVERV